MQIAKPLYIPGLDGFRALAVMVVILTHYGVAGISGYIPGAFGVEVFFFISGFLITRLLLAEDSAGGIGISRFWLRRILRLLPGLLLMLVTVAMVWPIMGWAVSYKEMGAAFFYIFNYYIEFGSDHVIRELIPIWSLCVEEHYYFLFPLLLAFTRGSKGQRYGAVAALIVVPLFLRVVYFYNGYGAANYYHTETSLDIIAWGCLLGMQAHDHKVSWFKKIPVWLAVMVGCTIVFSFTVYKVWYTTVFSRSVHVMCLYLLFGAIYFGDHFGWFVQILELKVLKFLGKISYELYLWHMPVLGFLGAWLPVKGSTHIVAALTLTMLIAWLAYQLADKPLTPVRRKLHNRLGSVSDGGSLPSQVSVK